MFDLAQAYASMQGACRQRLYTLLACDRRSTGLAVQLSSTSGKEATCSSDKLFHKLQLSFLLVSAYADISTHATRNELELKFSTVTNGQVQVVAFVL
jgi:hypothetical protein